MLGGEVFVNAGKQSLYIYILVGFNDPYHFFSFRKPQFLLECMKVPHPPPWTFSVPTS